MSDNPRHACYAVQRGHDHFRCRACAFEGTLFEALGHVVAHQWYVG